MKVRVALKIDSREIDSFEFDVAGMFDGGSAEVSEGMRAAYDKFRKNHPSIAMFNDGTNIVIGKA